MTMIDNVRAWFVRRKEHRLAKYAESHAGIDPAGLSKPKALLKAPTSLLREALARRAGLLAA